MQGSDHLLSVLMRVNKKSDFWWTANSRIVIMCSFFHAHAPL